MSASTRSRSLWPLLFVFTLAVSAGGCSSSTTTSGLSFVDEQGNHPAGWIEAHPSFARPDGSACTQCHGSDLQGGIAGVSCFAASRDGQGCHAGGPAFHPPEWLNKTGGTFHGQAFLDDLLVNGLACTDCHNPAAPSDPPGFICLDCHFTIEGQRVPSGASYLHGQISGHDVFLGDNTVNLVCQRCHETNNRFGNMPQPFCHNCHEPFPTAFHPTGWANPDAHGPGAKGVPGVQSGFVNCQSCHETDFTGSGFAPSCLNNVFCHGSGVLSPHSPAPWRSPLSARTHTDTETGNAPVCGLCHLGGGTVVITPPTPVPPGVTPDCLNNTLCHGTVVPAGTHGTGWLDSDSAGFHGGFVSQITCETSECHPISGHPTCTTCHFDNQGSRADNSLGFAHDGNVFSNHREESFASKGNICENCHQTSRTFRAGAPPSGCGPTSGHPGDEGCHYNAALLDPVLNNSRF